MSNWFTIDSPPGYDAWKVRVRLGTMPDGSTQLIGLQLDPRDDYDGSIRNQRITSRRLGNFPVRYASIEAAYQRLQHDIEGINTDGDEFAALPAKRRNELLQRKIALLEQSQRLAMSGKAAAEEQRIHVKQEIRAVEVGTKTELLERIAALYAIGTDMHVDGGVRRYILSHFPNRSMGWVDKQIGKCRESGLIPPYEGAQGTYGKEPTETSGTQPGTPGMKKGQQP